MVFRKYRSVLFIVMIFFIYQGYGQKSVLFLGNSHTNSENFPNILSEMVLADGDTLTIEVNAPGGCTFAHPSNGHLYNQTSLNLINSRVWDYVVLQEHSTFPVIPYYRDSYTIPGAYQLNEIIKENSECTRTMFFLMWGKENGGIHCINDSCSIEFMDYYHMQDTLTSFFLSLTNFLDAELSPAGEAWKNALLVDPDLNLWHVDESHPSLIGAYLNACTFFTTILHKSPIGNSFNPGIDEDLVDFLQTIAYETVYGNVDLWNIDTLDVVAEFDYSIDFDEIIFENQSFLGEDFIWDFGDGNYSTEDNPVHVYASNGLYNVKLLSLNGCKKDSIIKEINVDFVHSELFHRDKIHVSPNPVMDNISITGIPGGDIVQIELINNNGQLILSERRISTSEIHITGLDRISAGVYMLRIYDETEIVCYSIIKK